MSPTVSDNLARACASMLASLPVAHMGGRRQLYIWEVEAFLALHAYREAGGRVPLNDWTMTFLRVNIDALRADLPVNWNLRDAKAALPLT
jgi:hypothetical protein